MFHVKHSYLNNKKFPTKANVSRETFNNQIKNIIYNIFYIVFWSIKFKSMLYLYKITLHNDKNYYPLKFNIAILRVNVSRETFNNKLINIIIF